MHPPSDQAPAVRQLRRAFLCSICAVAVPAVAGYMPVMENPADPYGFSIPRPSALPSLYLYFALVALDAFFLLRAWHLRQPGFLADRHVPALAFSFLLLVYTLITVPMVIVFDYTGYD